MRFKRYLTKEDPKQFSLIAFVNLFFIIFVFFMMPPTIAEKTGAKIDLPKVITSDIINDERLVIKVLNDNLIYFDNQQVSLEGLSTILNSRIKKTSNILIKAARSVSLEKISGIVSLCQDLGFEQVNIATLK